MKKICYIISDVDRAQLFEWIAESLKNSYKLYFVLLNNRRSAFEDFLKENNFGYKLISVNSKRDWPKALFTLYETLKKIKPDIVHCHFFEANILGLTSAKLAGVRSRIYTRHFSSLHHVYFKKGIYWDKLCNRLSTKIVSISNVVTNILVNLEKVPEKKIVRIPHALKIDSFTSVEEERIKALRIKYQIPESAYVVGVISRLTKWKGVQYIIPAFAEFFKVEPNAILLLLNAHGDYEKEILELLETIPSSHARVIKFETDIQAAYKLMNVFIHVPIDNHSEAFGLIYIEALAAQVPAIFTLSGVAPDFIKHDKNALVVPFKNSKAIYESMVLLHNDLSLSPKLRSQGIIDVEKGFSFDLMINRLNSLYASL